MDTEAISNEILEIRERLAEIEAERARLPSGEYEKKADLQTEERDLRARLAHLHDKLATPGRGTEDRSSDDVPPPRMPEIPPM